MPSEHQVLDLYCSAGGVSRALDEHGTTVARKAISQVKHRTRHRTGRATVACLKVVRKSMSELQSETEDRYVCGLCDKHLGDLIGIVQHLSECEPVLLSAESLSRRERNTLMYIENRVVDHGGQLSLEQMNYEDRQNIKVFKAAGILEVSHPRRNPDNAREDIQQVELFTDAAWDIVRDCRQITARAKSGDSCTR